MDLNIPQHDACAYVQTANQAQGFTVGQQFTLQGHKARLISFGCRGDLQLGAWLEVIVDQASGQSVYRHVKLADLAAELRKGA